jgi:hypothetical protein
MTHFIYLLIQASYLEATNNYKKKQLAIMSDVTHVEQEMFTLPEFIVHARCLVGFLLLDL